MDNEPRAVLAEEADELDDKVSKLQPLPAHPWKKLKKKLSTDGKFLLPVNNAR